MAIKTDFIDMEKYGTDILVDPNNLSMDFANQASLYAHYATAVHRAGLQVISKKLLMDAEIAKLDREIREAAVVENKKTTEEGIKNTMRSNPKYIVVAKDHLEAEEYYALCKSLLDAFKQRKDMLIQMGADAREEMKGEMRMSAANQYRKANGIAAN